MKQQLLETKGELAKIKEECYRRMKLWSFRGSVQFFDFKELLSWLIKNKLQLELFAVTVWSIWNQRNRVRLNEPADELHQIAHLSKVRLAEFKARQVVPVTQVQQPRHSRCRWKPPPSESFKINFDGSVFPSDKKSSIGVVIRDCRGLVIASCSKLVHQELGSNDIEAIAAGWVLSFALEVGVKRGVLEGDSLVVMKGLREAERSLALLGLLLEDAQNLSQKFDELLYAHTKRKGNTLAHCLARHAIGIPDFLIWMEDIPSQFQDVLQADLLGIF